MRASVLLRPLLFGKLVIGLILLGILMPWPSALATELSSGVRSSELNILREVVTREIGRDAMGRWHIIYKTRQRPEDGIWRAQTTDVKHAGVRRTGSFLSPGQVPLHPIETQWDIAAEKAIKILVKEQGWYRVRQPELVAAGLSPRANPMKLQLYVDGQEQAIRVVGQQDRRFDSEDFIEFYATGLDTPFTDTRTYFLLEGEVLGKRITTSQGRGAELAPDRFPCSVTFREIVYYLPQVKNGEADNFFGPAVAPMEILPPGFLDVYLGVTNLDPSPPLGATLEIALQGIQAVAHHIKVLVNDAEVGHLDFTGQVREVFELELPQARLKEGENKITLIPEGGEWDVSVVDYIQLTYWHRFVADNNILKFQAEGGKRVTITGFTRPRIRVIDYTDPWAVREVIGDIESHATGYTVTFKAPESGTRALMAFTGDKVKTPFAIVANKPSHWHERMPGYDFLIISHKDFLKPLKLLQQRRESQGLSVALVDVEDLYDEFNFGNKSPHAIREFLVRTARHWNRGPRFVLLVGDASFDPRNYFGVGNYDFLPTKIVETFYLETASDDWFVDLDDDGLPDKVIGRLPVRTVHEAATVVTKILDYEKASRMDHAVMVADKLGYFEFDYAAASREVGALIPSSIVVEEIFRENYDTNASAKEALLASIHGGPLLVNYIGDGSVEMWEGQILNSTDARSLTNGPQLPLFVNMTSLNGFFHDLYTECLAEALLNSENGGAIAVWASSGLTEPDSQAVMNKEFVRLLFNGEGLTIGEAATRAKASTEDQDVRKTWMLFGDPTTKLQY